MRTPVKVPRFPRTSAPAKRARICPAHPNSLVETDHHKIANPRHPPRESTSQAQRHAFAVLDIDADPPQLAGRRPSSQAHHQRSPLSLARRDPIGTRHKMILPAKKEELHAYRKDTIVVVFVTIATVRRVARDYVRATWYLFLGKRPEHLIPLICGWKPQPLPVTSKST